MKIQIVRKYKKEDYTIGSLYIDGEWICNTLEPKDRGLKQTMPLVSIAMTKVMHETAIPAGTYQVKMLYSKKFNAQRPFLLDVPGFSGIMIHEGNTKRDTHGCILVGRNTAKGMLTSSRLSLGEVMSRMSGEVKIEISEAPYMPVISGEKTLDCKERSNVTVSSSTRGGKEGVCG